MIYTLYFSEYGIPKAGLTPTIDVFIKVNDGTSAGVPPSVNELPGGFYKFTATPTEALLVRVNSGNATAADADKYKVMQIGPNDGSLDAPISAVDTNVDSILVDTGMDLPTMLTTVASILSVVDTEVGAIKAKTDLLPDGVIKNIALNNFMFLMVELIDHVTPKTGLTITAERSIDGAAFAACANPVFEISNGIYKINLATSDLNGDIICLKFTATGADARYITIKTQT
jgi:hypothetical protein